MPHDPLIERLQVQAVARQDGNSPTNQVWSPSISFYQRPQNVSKCSVWCGRLLSRCRLTDLLIRLRRKWIIIRLAFGSLLGHIRLQPSTTILSLPGPIHRYGQVWPRGAHSYIARSFYRQMVSHLYPWADTVDLRLFLMGFDAGEQWLLHISGKEECKPQENSWLALAETEFGYVPDLVNQWVKKTTPEHSTHDRSTQPPLRESVSLLDGRDRSCKTQRKA